MPEFESVQDILLFAITLEQASQDFYKQLVERTDSPAVSHFLQQLGLEECFHEQKLREVLESDDAILQSGNFSREEIALYIQASDIPSWIDYKGAIQVAMNKERASEMLYSILAQSIDNPGYAELFRKLSFQEKSHKDFFETEYRRICISEN